jgi:hypothetical protein
MQFILTGSTEVFGVAVLIMGKIMGSGGKTSFIMNSLKRQWCYLSIIVLSIIVSCNSNKEQHNSLSDPSPESVFDSLIIDIKDLKELITSELIENKLLDTTDFFSVSETAYPDTIIQLNDSIFYSIISINDKLGVCTYLFAASINEKSKRAVASTYLHSDCDIDLSQESYDLYDHENISKDSIKVIKTITFQKEKRTSINEDENIDHKEIEESYLIISPNGKMHLHKNK